jgi:ATP-dependent helicase/nuclease subunit A
MSRYEVDGQDADAAQFLQAALDPRGSAVVEACAGSGKTWLLVARIVRLLMDGARPASILAITFTRRAAQEMRERLLADLARLARGNAHGARQFLAERGLAADDAAVARARGLLEAVLAGGGGPLIETFHGWFARLLQGAPLEAGPGYGAAMIEDDSAAWLAAWDAWCAHLLTPAGRAESGDFEELVHLAGDSGAYDLLESAVERRADWREFLAAEGPGRALAPLRQFIAQALGDPLWHEEAAGGASPLRALFVRKLEPPLATLCAALGAALGAAAPGKQLGKLLEQMQAWRTAPAPPPSPPSDRWALQHLQGLEKIFITGEGTPRKALEPASLARTLGSATRQGEYAGAYAALLKQIALAGDVQREWEALRLTASGLRCALALARRLDEGLRARGEVAVAELEAHAARLVEDPGLAAYTVERLDARYRHILVDEFQDTNPMQWRVLCAWLGAYGHDALRPTVFLVGDPKQAIYRFRGAEPRLFALAAAQLERDFGARRLRTSLTRRNPPELVRLLDAVFATGNPLYAAQEAFAPAGGRGVQLLRLPLVAGTDEEEAAEEDGAQEHGAQEQGAQEQGAEPDAAPARGAAATVRPPEGMGGAGTGGAGAVRDLLREARAQPPAGARLEEARRIARWLQATLPGLRLDGPDGSTRDACWRDVLVLVRARTYVDQFEQALREAGIPHQSARRASLLERLEVADLLALLAALEDPRDNLALAAALRSPFLACTEDDLLRLAQATQDPALPWSRRLAAMTDPGPRLARARGLLAGWTRVAGRLPVHDLLDRILAQGQVRAAYARTVPEADHVQVQANLDALLELALEQDAGRLPSLRRFLAAVQERSAAAGAGAEEGVTAGEDAVRVLTVHGAKGLEAAVVVLPDAHGGEPKEDRNGLLFDWLPGEPVPRGVTALAAASLAGPARQAVLAADRQQRAQEENNLLYVALTRASHVLLVSGVVRSKPAALSWYARLEAAGLPEGAVPAADILPGHGAGVPAQPCGLRQFREVPGLACQDPGGADAPDRLRRMGLAWHALLETREGQAVHEQGAVLAAQGLTSEDAAAVLAARARVCGASHLTAFFGPAARVRCELELIDADGDLMRIDRLADTGDALWVVDTKWNLDPASLDPARLAQYRKQVRDYGQAVAAIHPGRTVRLLLVSAQADALEIDREGGADRPWPAAGAGG